MDADQWQEQTEWLDQANAASWQQVLASRKPRDQWLDVTPERAFALLSILKRFSAVSGIEGNEEHSRHEIIHAKWSRPRPLLLDYPEHWERPGVYIIHDVVRIQHPQTQGCVWRFYPRYVGKSRDIGARLLGYVNGTPGGAVVDNVVFDHMVECGPILPRPKPEPRELKKFMRLQYEPNFWDTVSADSKTRHLAMKRRELWVQVAHTSWPERLEQTMIRYYRGQKLTIWNDPTLYSITPPFAPPKKAPTPKEVFG